MAKSRFDYENSRWACGNAAVARRWYKELERTNPENVRASLAQTAGSRGAIPIGEVSMTIGFARDWLAWHDQQKALREVRFRRWQFIASASVLLCYRLGAEGMAEVVMASRARRSHPLGGLLLVGPPVWRGLGN